MKSVVDLTTSLKSYLIDKEGTTRATIGAHNLIPMRLSWIKANNTSGTWVNNAYTVNGVTFTVTADGDSVQNVNIKRVSSSSTNAVLDLGNKDFGDTSFHDYDESPTNGYICSSGQENSSSGTSFLYYGASSQLVRLRAESAFNNTTGLDYYPMIRLASDPVTAFTPYAMTNPEITNTLVNKALLEGGTVQLQVNVNSDGVKTYNELLNELANKMLALEQSLGDDEFIMYLGFRLGSTAYDIPNHYSKYSNSATSASFGGTTWAIDSATTRVYGYRVLASTTLSSCQYKYYSINSTGITLNDNGSVVPASGTSIYWYYALYKIVK